MFFYLKVSSKDEKILNNFSKLLLKLKTSFLALKYFPKKKRRKFVTVLNSPHVNKTAQEQFEFRLYKIFFLISSCKPSLFSLVLKDLKKSSFSGISIEIQGVFDESKKSQNKLFVIDPTNIKFNIYMKNNLKIKTQKQKYLQLFDCYGEMRLRRFFHCKF